MRIDPVGQRHEERHGGGEGGVEEASDPAGLAVRDVPFGDESREEREPYAPIWAQTCAMHTSVTRRAGSPMQNSTITTSPPQTVAGSGGSSVSAIVSIHHLG